jgi:hypothetical protein
MIRCKDCKWWGSTCYCSKFPLFICDGFSIDDKGLHAVNKSLADYAITIVTGANFGCIHGENKK